MHPGSVNTNMGKNERGVGILLFRAFKPFMRSPKKGADTLIYLAASPDVQGRTGEYFIDREVATSSKEAYDGTLREQLWEVSEELTNLKSASVKQ
jgi:hypothetical protein